MIRVREFVLDLLFGTIKKDAFNGIEGHCALQVNVPEAIGETILALKKQSAITDGGVDYAMIQQSEAYRYLQDVLYPCLRHFKIDSLASAEEKLAFWINLYNLLTIDAVIHYSVRISVSEGWFGVIRFFHRAAYLVGGLRFSLEDIEHGILRANRGVMFFPGRHFRRADPRSKFAFHAVDARIHFALNCASRSCPPIAYYAADKIYSQLDLAAANFMDAETHMDRSGVALHVPRIFKWYQKDFGGPSESLDWMRRYLPEGDMRRKLIDNFGDQTMLIYKRYDWFLNVLA